MGNQAQELARLVDLDRERKAADQAFRGGLQEAVEAGVPQTHIAEALGVSRMTVWRWLHQPQEDAPATLEPSGGVTTAQGGPHEQQHPEP